jgi:hypothetical protein
MKLRTWIAAGTFAFSVWRGWKNMKKSARKNAKTSLRRMERAI